jgi:uncharacterized protein YcnI
MNKLCRAFLLSVAALLTASSIAYAHVTVNPKNAEPGYGVATIRVPNEKESPTIAVRVTVPGGATVHGIKAVPGWTYTATRAEVTGQESGHDAGDGNEGRIIEVTWTGGQIGPGEFEEFPLSVQYGDPGEYAWKAYQTYADGETVSWDGGKDADNPASAVVVAEVQPSAMPAQQVVPQNQWLSILALLTALAALFISLRKK